MKGKFKVFTWGKKEKHDKSHILQITENQDQIKYFYSYLKLF